MTTDDASTPKEDDMTAATVEKPTEHDEPHRYVGDNPQARTPAVRQAPAPAADLEPTGEFKARIAGMVAALPWKDEYDETPPATLDEARIRVNRKAWRNSVDAAHLTDRLKWTLDQLANDQHPTVLRRYVQQIGAGDQVLNLVLGGRVGPGKTSAAIAAGNAAVERGLMARVVKHKHYLDWLRPDGTPSGIETWQIRKRYRDCDLLILDDLGAELEADREASRFVREETLALIGDRIESGKATIITTNEKPEVYAKRDGQDVLVGGLALTLGERLLSRISERGHALSFTGPDRRGRLSW